MSSRRATVLAVVLVMVLAGCGAFGPGSDGGAQATPEGRVTSTPAASPSDSPTSGSQSGEPPATAASQSPSSQSSPSTSAAAASSDSAAGEGRSGYADPEADVIGWEDGVWYDEPIQVDQSDGLTDAELAAYVGRSKARVEQLRRQEFVRDVDVEVLSRAEYAASERARTNETGTGETDESSESSATFDRWNDQVWEALFVVDEEANVSDAFDSLGESLVLGQYFPGEDKLVVVSDNPDRPVIDNETLVHELVHAMQDQQGELNSSLFAPETQDQQLADNGLTEGEAEYVAAVYVEKCNADWDCVETPTTNQPTPDYDALNLGVILVTLQPYSDGPPFVASLVENGGWAAVDDAHDTPPQTTERVIHLDEVDDETPLAVGETARNGWTRYSINGDGADTVGEASIFVMFWYQNYEYGNAIVDRAALTEPDAGQYDTYNYTSRPSEGWANDKIVPYRKGDRDAYVWVSEWDTERDAQEFHDAYLRLLQGQQAEQTGESTWVVPNGGFADAFYVTRDGTRVVVVNAPTQSDLADVSDYAR